MPFFECSRCHRKIRVEYEVSCTGDKRCNVEKPPCCCGEPMNEILDD